MIRVKRGNAARKRRKKILAKCRGYQGAHSSLFRIAYQQAMKALRYSSISRKLLKRSFRKLWICRINAACRLNRFKLNYSKFMKKLKKSNMLLNRKMISQLAIHDFWTFTRLIE